MVVWKWTHFFQFGELYDIFYPLAKIKRWCLKPKGCLISPQVPSIWHLEGPDRSLQIMLLKSTTRFFRFLTHLKWIEYYPWRFSRVKLSDLDLGDQFWSRTEEAGRVVLNWVFQVISGDSIRDLSIPDHWRSRFQPWKSRIPKRSLLHFFRHWYVFFSISKSLNLTWFFFEVCKCSSCFNHWLFSDFLTEIGNRSLTTNPRSLRICGTNKASICENGATLQDVIPVLYVQFTYIESHEHGTHFTGNVAYLS